MQKLKELDPKEEMKRRIDYFSLKGKVFMKIWHISLTTAMRLYGKKGSVVESFPEERMEEAREDHKKMRIVDFSKKYNIGFTQIRKIFGEKPVVRRGRAIGSKNKEMNTSDEYIKRNSQFKKAMEMFDISRDEVNQLLLLGGWTFSEIFAGEKINGKVIPKNLFPKKVYKN